MHIRPATPDDLDAIMRIQAEAYGQTLIESRACMAERLNMQDSLSLIAAQHNQAIAYLLMYCSTPGKITPFNGPFIACPENTTIKTLYLHDLAVSNSGRGLGIATQLIEQARSCAQKLGCHSMSLVAVQDALPFWQKNGFHPLTANEQQNLTLNSYADNAVFCIATVD